MSKWVSRVYCYITPDTRWFSSCSTRSSLLIWLKCSRSLQGRTVLVFYLHFDMCLQENNKWLNTLESSETKNYDFQWLITSAKPSPWSGELILNSNLLFYMQRKVLLSASSRLWLPLDPECWETWHTRGVLVDSWCCWHPGHIKAGPSTMASRGGNAIKFDLD